MSPPNCTVITPANITNHAGWVTLFEHGNNADGSKNAKIKGYFDVIDLTYLDLYKVGDLVVINFRDDTLEVKIDTIDSLRGVLHFSMVYHRLD